MKEPIMATHQPGQCRVDRLRIHNSQKKLLDFTIEPWGDVHPMPSGDVLEVVAKGPGDGFLEIDLTEDGLTAYGWSGSVVSVFRSGKALAGASGDLPVPVAPPGKSIKEFVGWMNKKTDKK